MSSIQEKYAQSTNVIRRENKKEGKGKKKDVYTKGGGRGKKQREESENNYSREFSHRRMADVQNWMRVLFLLHNFCFHPH